jgi:hypothetical protein
MVRFIYRFTDMCLIPAAVMIMSPNHQFDFLDFEMPPADSISQSTSFGETFSNMEGLLPSNSCPIQPPALNPATMPTLTSPQSGESDSWSQSIVSEPFPPADAPVDNWTEDLFNRLMSQGLPKIDPSLLVLSPPPDILVQSPQNGDTPRPDAAKQAKLEQLQAHREAARRLEAELSM